jgi:predicted Zn finger-like uncharacterized protein
MDVRCNRCATEYDFDDALISERGTTVKCTNCGYQFKVFPPQAQAGTPERWLVKTSAGEELVYTSLRELQRGIADRQVGPNDLLSRGKQAARPLGSIAELEPFFSSSLPPSNPRPVRTLHGVAPAPGARTSTAPSGAQPSFSPPVEETPATLPPGTPDEVTLPISPMVTPEAFAPTQRAGLAPEPAPPEASRNRTPPGGTLIVNDPRTKPEVSAPISAAAPVSPRVSSAARAELLTPSPARAAIGSSPFSTRGSSPELRSSPNSSPFSARGSSPELRSSPNSSPFSAGRRDLRSYDELASDDLPEVGNRARSRWIAAVVIAGVTTLFAVTVGRRYLLESAGPAAQASATSSARVNELLREGNRLIEEGDLEAASEPLLRATGLAERDRGVLAALARLETLRADTTWLRLRLLDPQQAELLQATHRELGRRVGKARSAADAAFAVGPEDIVVLRARVDTLRLSGEADKAREWIKPIASNPSDPQNAYVLAALDLADPSPAWSSVIDRLHTAASGERVPGRAHAALVYALARGGRVAEAETELSKLDASPSAALLIDELKSFIKRFGKTADAGASAAVAAVDPRKLGKLDTSQPEEPRAGAEAARAPAAAAGEEARAGGGDFRKLLAEASDALHKGDLARAHDLYQRVLAAQPGNTEATAGLADIARRQNDPAEAARLYDRVLEGNPSYLPALMARADQQWDSGNKKAAIVLYRRVVDQAGSGSEYGQRAAARIAQGQAQDSERAPASEAAPSKPAAPAAPTPPSTPDPGIDTSDLPGFK